MPTHLTTAGDEPVLTGHDRMTCFLMGRLQVVEAALFALALRSGQLEGLRADLTAIVAAWRKRATDEDGERTQSPEEAAMFDVGYTHALRSILSESKPEKS